MCTFVADWRRGGVGDVIASSIPPPPLAASL